MSTYTIPILLGTSRTDNQSRHIAKFLHASLSKDKNIHCPFLDLREADFPILTQKVSPENPITEMLAEWTAVLQNSNAIIIVCPEYKSGYPGSLKNFLDYLPPGIFRYKPIGISTVSSGVYAGTSCLSQLRQVVIAMAGMVIPDRFQVGPVQSALNDAHEIHSDIHRKISSKFIAELIKYTEAMYPLQNS